VDKANDNLLTSSICLGADILVKLLNNYTRVNDVKQIITVGIIGLPNVGKSSVINSLKRSHACMIGSMPGLTRFDFFSFHVRIFIVKVSLNEFLKKRNRCMQEIKLDKHIKLLDCPGIVMARDEDSASLALKNCIKVENLEDPLAPIDLLINRCNHEQLILRYKIGEFADAVDFLTQVARRHGKVKKGGVADVRKAAQLILNDWTGYESLCYINSLRYLF
jgi:nuclear GTP-binding protein